MSIDVLNIKNNVRKSYIRDDRTIVKNRGKGYDDVIYFDYQATTPLDDRVLDSMLPYLTEHFGNPHSRNHVYGWVAEEAVNIARKQVADLINADPRDIVFTSGATNANNLAIKGCSRFCRAKKDHIITLQTEHKCVLGSCMALEREGFKVTYLPVQSNGIVDLNKLEESITDKTALVSVMFVNNEIGVIQPIEAIGRLCRQKGVMFHTDAAQAFGKIPIDVDSMCIDLMSISGHKIYAPKGIGALYVRRKPRVRLEPVMSGGGQERGIVPGTLAPYLAVGLGRAAEIASQEMERDSNHVNKIFGIIYDNVMNNMDYIYLNGDKDKRYHGNLNLSFAYIEGESLMMRIKEIAVSSGSACTSESLEPSYVLRALGVSEDLAHTSIRFGFGRFTTEDEAYYVADVIVDAAKQLRDMSPLWEMVQEGIDLNSIEWSEH